jgi:hypothetical protein
MMRNTSEIVCCFSVCSAIFGQRSIFSIFGLDANRSLYFYNLKMIKKTALVALLCVLTFQQTVLVASGVATTTIVNPLGQKIALEPYHNRVNPKHLPGAQWVWKSGGEAWAEGDTVYFESRFYADCSSGPVTLKITADNSFSATLNGGAAVTGDNWTKVYSFAMTGLVCGVNKL